MNTFIDNYLKMPEQLLVLGGMFYVVAAVYLMVLLKSGYWRGIFANLFLTLREIKWQLILCFLVIIAVISCVDRPLAQLCHTYFNSSLYTATDFICSMAEGWFVCGVLLSISIIAILTIRLKLAALTNIAFTAALYAALVNSVFKIIFSRERPVIGMHNWHFFRGFMQNRGHLDDLFYAYNSMPSGHTVMVIAALTPFFMYTKSPFIRIILIMLSVLVGYARIYTLNHWLSDVLVSASLGILIGYSSYQTNKWRLALANESTKSSN